MPLSINASYLCPTMPAAMSNSYNVSSFITLTSIAFERSSSWSSDSFMSVKGNVAINVNDIKRFYDVTSKDNIKYTEIVTSDLVLYVKESYDEVMDKISNRYKSSL